MDDEQIKPETVRSGKITLNIKHVFPEDLRLTFVDNVAVQHTPTEFVLTFAQSHQPILFSEDEYKKLTEIRADVVARIVMTPPKMLELIQALQN